MPFCFHKCHYCDFYSIVTDDVRHRPFVDRMITELAEASARFTEPLHTIFVGGGTPSLLAPPLWKRLGSAIRAYLPLADDVEFTIEANPETVTEELAATLVEAGVNRVSIGAQTFHPEHLRTLERWHDPANVARAVERFRAAGIANLNLDLIFGIPGQTIAEWRDDLHRVLALQPTHLSCYALTFEANTPLEVKRRQGVVQQIDEEIEAEMYIATLDAMEGEGFEHYEISNWARPGRACRHNLAYWMNESWWPFGPSAAGHVNGIRWRNMPKLQMYLDHGPLPPICDAEQLDADARVGEMLMLRLRLREGLMRDELDAVLARSADGGERRMRIIDQQIEAGNLEWCDERVRFTRRGLLLADSVLAELL